MNLKRKILIGLMVLQTSFLSAQDFHLTMYDAAPMFLNPALTGVVDADWRVHGQYRTQWKAVNYKPYTTALISFDKPYKKWGFGGQVANFRAGLGNYNAAQAVVSAAYTLNLDKKRFHNLSFGVQGGLSQKSVEYQLLTYNNQYVTTNGGGFDNSLSSNENFAGQSFVIPNLNAGAIYYFAKQQTLLNPFVGVSVFNLLTPKETFFNGANKLPIRYYTHVGTRINITEVLYVIPKVLVMHQQKFNEMTFAGDIGYYLKNNDMYLLGGMVYRAKDAFSLSIGARLENITAKFAYDVNASSLTSATGGRGGFELSLTYIHKKSDYQKVKICPRL